MFYITGPTGLVLCLLGPLWQGKVIKMDMLIRFTNVYPSVPWVTFWVKDARGQERLITVHVQRPIVEKSYLGGVRNKESGTQGPQGNGENRCSDKLKYRILLLEEFSVRIHTHKDTCLHVCILPYLGQCSKSLTVFYMFSFMSQRRCGHTHAISAHIGSVLSRTVDFRHWCTFTYASILCENSDCF